MSTLRANIYSICLNRTVDISVILPNKAIGKEIVPSQGFKTIYLLNGFTGDDLDWLHQTRIKQLAETYNYAVVMPSGENGFYVDDVVGRRFFSQFVGEELVELTRALFPLSTKREDTVIAGLSMGGYGALYNGLKYNKTFGHVGAFSSGVLNILYEQTNQVNENLNTIEHVFGNKITKIKDTIEDPRYLALRVKDQLPELYIACGNDDFVFVCSEEIHRHYKANDIKHTYVKGPGTHTWDYWDQQIEQFFKWLEQA